MLEEKQEVEWRVMELEEKFEEKNKEQQELIVSITRVLLIKHNNYFCLLF